MTGGLTASEEAIVISLLGKAEQPYSRQFTEALLGRIPALAVELVVLCRRNGVVHVLLTKRPADPDDPWAGEWHCPGSVAREDDLGGIPAIIERLEEGELGCKLRSARRVYEHANPNFGGRKLSMQFVYLGQVAPGAETHGEWYAVNNLPHNIMAEHIPMIQRVVTHF